MSDSVVWFQRDLRVADHAPLATAAARGPVLCLYVIEPRLWAAAGAATKHLHWALDQDPKGRFVRRWLPAMRRVPDAWLFEPWRMPPEMQARCGLRPDELPQPLVDLEPATREAKARLCARRGQPEVRAAQAAIAEWHGSRKRPAVSARAPGRRRAPAATNSAQASLF